MSLLRSLPVRGWRRAAIAAAALGIAALAARAGDPPSLFHLGPENIGVDTVPSGGGTAPYYSHQIDSLYHVIFWIVAVAFVATESILLWFLFRFRATPGGKAVYTHGNHRLEVIWTLVPAAILVWLAFYQFGAWTQAKVDKPKPSEGLVVQVMAKQFEWQIRYAGPDGIFGSDDDIYTVGELRVPVDTNVTVQLRTQDVLHSFFLPHLRLKQDTVPGLTINQWFRVKAGKTTEEARAARGDPAFNYEIACAELCGSNHTKMRGTLVVQSEKDFFQWLDAQYLATSRGFDKSEQLIARFWPGGKDNDLAAKYGDQNKLQDTWLRDRWPADLKAKWPK